MNIIQHCICHDSHTAFPPPKPLPALDWKWLMKQMLNLGYGKTPVKLTCVACGETKTDDQFRRHGSGTPRKKCKKCEVRLNREHRKKKTLARLAK